jgi:hypothetical protein
MNGLERRYRRLLAWYPTWFRLQNEEEILAVLLACAQDGQRRPGVEPTLPYLHAEQILAGLGGDRLGSGL